MAKLDMGILGGFSGRVGTVVGYYRRGAWFVRAYQPHIKDRKSAAQLEQRSRFKAMIQFASPATPVLRVGLRQVAADWQITEGNAFLKINKESFPRESRNTRNSRNSRNTRNSRESRESRESRNSRAIDYTSLQFSRGSLAAPQALQYAVDEGGVLAVRWSAGGGRLADRIHIYVYCPAAMTGIALEGERGRHGLQSLLPQDFVGEELHLWAFAAAADGMVSPTVYGAPATGDAAPTPHTPNEEAAPDACTAAAAHGMPAEERARCPQGQGSHRAEQTGRTERPT